MNKERFEQVMDRALVVVLSFALGGFACQGFLDLIEDDQRASEVDNLTELVFELREDINEVCSSMPEDPNSAELSDEDTTINHPPITTPTTLGYNSASNGEKQLALGKFDQQEVSFPSPTTTVVQPPPCP